MLSRQMLANRCHQLGFGFVFCAWITGLIKNLIIMRLVSLHTLIKGLALRRALLDICKAKINQRS